MAKPSTQVKVGVFVLAGLAIIVAGVLVLGAGNLLRPTIKAETYIDESVQGLDVGSPVKYRGVQIGRVSEVGFVRTEYGGDDNPSELERMVLIRITLFPRSFAERASLVQVDRDLKQMIDKGLRVRLASQGLTGTNYLEADYLPPDLYPPRAITWEPDTLYIPSAPSKLSRLTNAAETVMQNLERTDIARLIDEATGLVQELRGTNEALRGFFDTSALTAMREDLAQSFANLKRLSESAGTTGTDILLSARDAVRRLGEVTGVLQRATGGDRLPNIVADSQAAAANMRRATADLPQTMATLRGAIQRLDGILVTGQGDIAATLDNIHIATENLRQLSETAKRYPSQVLFGTAPPGAADRSGANR